MPSAASLPLWASAAECLGAAHRFDALWKGSVDGPGRIIADMRRAMQVSFCHDACLSIPPGLDPCLFVEPG